jgi:hypothetical protein
MAKRVYRKVIGKTFVIKKKHRSKIIDFTTGDVINRIKIIGFLDNGYEGFFKRNLIYKMTYYQLKKYYKEV